MSILTLKDMENLISGFTCDCSCKYKGYETEHGGCFKQNFETDEETKWSEMSRFLLFYRMTTQNYSDVENDAFVLELVKKHATNVEDVVDETEALEKSTLGELTSTAKTTENRFKMNWNIKVKSGKLPGSRTELKLCRKAFAFLYGFTPNRFKLASQAMKTAGSSDISSIKAVRDFDHSTSFSEYTYDEVENIYMQNGLTIAGKDEIAAALLRGTYAHHDAYLWLEDYFDSFDMQPDSAQIHVDVTFKRAIYLEYCARPTDNINLRNRSLQESEFRQMWAMVYSHVRIRKSKKVSGKCWTCANINEVRRARKCRDVQEACKHLMMMHRGSFFMLERLEYRRRVQEATQHKPNSVMSTIIDGASQNHCKIPHLGPNVEFSNPLEQHIEGALTHGLGLTIYRSFPTVAADSDFTIYCLLEELHKWMLSKGHYPEVWYIQIDGGSENANQYLFAIMEFLVIKRICKKIVLTR